MLNSKYLNQENLISIPILGFIILFSSCVNSATETPVTWQKSFDRDVGSFILHSNNGGFLVGNVTGTILKLDAEGSIVWQVVFNSQVQGADEIYIHDIIERSRGGFAGIGYKGNQSGPSELIYFTIGEKGTLETSSILPGVEQESNFTLAESEQGFSVFGGLAGLDSTLTAFVIDLDAGGTVTDERSTELKLSNRAVIEEVLVVSGNSAFIVKTQHEIMSGNELYAGNLIRFDKQLNIQWSTPVGDPVFQETRSGIDTGDGYLFVGTKQSNGWAYKVTTSGDIEWEITYGSGREGRRFLWDIKKTPGRGYLIAGSNSENSDRSFDAWLVKIDGEGRLSWEQTYGSAEYDDARSLTLSLDGGFAVTGATDVSTDEFSNLRMWVLKIDENGNL